MARRHALTRDEKLQCDRRSEALLGETLACFAGFDSARLDPTEWRLLARRGQVAVHRAMSAGREGVGAHKRRVVATGFLDCSLNDVISGLYAEDDVELLTTQALMSPANSRAVDAAVLLVEERREPRAAPFRFAGVKWYLWNRSASTANAASLSVDAQECDLLTYERMGTALADREKDTGTQEVAYHVLLSMHKPEWPLNVARGPGLRRTELAMCFLFRKVCGDLVECFTLVDYDSRVSATSRRAADTEVADRVLMVTRLPDCARARVLSNFARKARNKPVTMSKICLRCGKKRKVLDLLRNCSICKKSVCQKCFELKPVFSINSRSHEPEVDAFCRKCLAGIDALTAASNATKTSGSGDGDSSNGGSSKGKTKEVQSTGSVDSSGSKRGFKFWRKSSKSRMLPTIDRENRRHSLPAVTGSASESHGPNYEALFRNYDVFGDQLEDPAQQWRIRNPYALERYEEQEPEQEKESAEPQEKRKRQTTFLADPDAVAAEAEVANLLKSSRAPEVTRQRRDNTSIAEVYPVAKTVLETEDIYVESPDDVGARSEAERTHRLYLERQQQLVDRSDQARYSRRSPLPTEVANGLKDEPLQSTTTDNRTLRSQSAPPQHLERKPAMPARRTESSSRRGGTRARQQEDEDVFRMDLYGRF